MVYPSYLLTQKGTHTSSDRPTRRFGSVWPNRSDKHWVRSVLANNFRTPNGSVAPFFIFLLQILIKNWYFPNFHPYFQIKIKLIVKNLLVWKIYLLKNLLAKSLLVQKFTCLKVGSGRFGSAVSAMKGQKRRFGQFRQCQRSVDHYHAHWEV